MVKERLVEHVVKGSGLTFATVVVFLLVTKRFYVRLPHGCNIVVVSWWQMEL